MRFGRIGITALSFSLSMIFSENRYPLFRIMLFERSTKRLMASMSTPVASRRVDILAECDRARLLLEFGKCEIGIRPVADVRRWPKQFLPHRSDRAQNNVVTEDGNRRMSLLFSRGD
jgi:hypothetical protein